MTSIFSTKLTFAGTSCVPFRIHQSVKLPPSPTIQVPRILPKNWEHILTQKIGSIKTHENFTAIYKTWLNEHPFDLTEVERFSWLHCLYYYVKMDTNKNGIPDWTAIVDHQPSQVLFPNDPDQDGDGIPNILDSDPLDSKVGEKLPFTEIPAHLKIKRAESAGLQEELFKKFSILAIDHSDEHSAVVLKELLSLLENALGAKFKLKNLHYIYAFSGHDPFRNVAAYHHEAQALSVAGKSSYPKSELSPQERVDLIAALAHELGHAILFEKLSAKELAQASKKFSGWSITGPLETLYSKGFFQPYFSLDKKNIVSQYSMKNRHEWFAESMAAALLNKIGQKGLLGQKWQNHLVKIPSPNSSSYWVNYNNIKSEFRRWLELLIKK